MQKVPRAVFAKEFKEEAVKMVIDGVFKPTRGMPHDLFFMILDKYANLCAEKREA